MLPAHLHGILEVLDDERRQHILQLNIERRLRRADSDPFTLTDTSFVQLYRLTKDMVATLMQQLLPHMLSSTQSKAIDPRIRIFAALRFFATGSYQRLIGESHLLSMAQNTISNCISEISGLIVEEMSEDYIKFPTEFQETLSIKRKFMEHSHFPGCIGAVDCTHVSILAPNEETHNYLNRKGYYSKNIQIICDPDLKILNINSRYAGATHDAFIWRHSAVREHLEEAFNNGDRNSWLIGDSGYPQEPWLMTPILNAVPGTAEERYNARHTSARNCIERCNGVLKTRFRCLLGERKLRYNPEKAGNIAIACAVLHNMCIAGRLINEHVAVLPNENDNYNQVQGNIEDNNMGRNARINLIERYFM